MNRLASLTLSIRDCNRGHRAAELLGKIDFEGHLASQIEPESELKTRGVKSAKFDSRVGGSSIFEVPRGSEIDENRCQEDFKIRPHLKSKKNLKKLPT